MFVLDWEVASSMLSVVHVFDTWELEENMSTYSDFFINIQTFTSFSFAAFQVLGITCPSIVSSLYAPLSVFAMTRYGPSHFCASFP